MSERLNKQLLEKVRNRIAEMPESYSQENFYAPDSSSPCGTVACLAGETIIVSFPTVTKGIERLKKIWDDDYGDWDSIADAPVAIEAAKLLGLDEEETETMFAADVEWPQPFQNEFNEAMMNSEDPTRECARVAVAYLDECLRRGKVTW